MVKDSPGPGTYDVRSYVGLNSRKFSLKSRIAPNDSTTRGNPSPNTYHPNFVLAEPSKFGAITFGFGTRCNVAG